MNGMSLIRRATRLFDHVNFKHNTPLWGMVLAGKNIVSSLNTWQLAHLFVL